MIGVTKENTKNHTRNWPQIADLWYGILTIRGSGFGKTNTLFNLIRHQLDIDNIYVYVKVPYGAKFQWLINKGEDANLKYCKDAKAFIEYWNVIDNIYENGKNIIQRSNAKYWPYLMIWLLMLLVIIVEIFIRGKHFTCF